MKLKDLKINWWLSAALDDPNVCQEFKYDINTFFSLFDRYEIINKVDLEELKESDIQLKHLKRNGVDNWEGYSYYEDYVDDDF